MHASKMTSMCRSVKTFFNLWSLGLWVHFTAQRRDLEAALGEERRQAHVINHSSSYAGLRGGSPSGPSGLESTKCTTCPTLSSDGKGEMVTVAEYKAWALHAQAWYETNSMAVPKKNFELLASIRAKPAQVIAACVPIELALGSDSVQKIGEVLDAYFGIDDCEGLLVLCLHLVLPTYLGCTINPFCPCLALQNQIVLNEFLHRN